MTRKWIGVDLDGTLAEKLKVYDPAKIGAPIPEMLAKVRNWMLHGINVRIFTARVYTPPDDCLRQREAAQATLAIQDWCIEHLGAVIPVTCQKDPDMIELYDDMAQPLPVPQGMLRISTGSQTFGTAGYPQTGFFDLTDGPGGEGDHE